MIRAWSAYAALAVSSVVYGATTMPSWLYVTVAILSIVLVIRFLVEEVER